MERVIAWRIHQVAYVENLYPRRYSNFSTAFINPMFPSWIRSRNDNPRLVYFLAIEMTSRRFASTISVLLEAPCAASLSGTGIAPRTHQPKARAISPDRAI